MITPKSAPSGTWNTIESFRTAIDMPIRHHESFQLPERTEKVINMVENGINTLAKFLWSRTSLLLELLETDEDTVMKWKYQIDLKKIKRKKKSGIGLETIPKLEPKAREALNSLEIYTVEDLYCLASDINYDKETDIDKELVDKLIANLNGPAMLLYDMPLGVEKRLKSKNINSAIHFLLLDDKYIAKEIGIKLTDVRQAKQFIHFRTEEELKKRISQAFGF
jgi:hypothetical protein